MICFGQFLTETAGQEQKKQTAKQSAQINMTTSINLTETPEVVTWPEQHYMYVEKIGPFFHTAPASWGELHRNLPRLREQPNVNVRKYFSLYKIEPSIYRAGVSVDLKPVELVDLSYTLFEGGKYAKYVLKGSYSNLPQACRRVKELFEASSFTPRTDGFYIENYATDPKVTPEDELITEILVPIQ